jgi:diguanylate cyclase (GGDEF)-like protein/PAS domain S-box-containing protein
MNRPLDPCALSGNAKASSQAHAALLDYLHSKHVFEHSLDEVLQEVAHILQADGGAIVEFGNRSYIAGRPNRAGAVRQDIIVGNEVRGRITVNGRDARGQGEALRLNTICVSCFLEHYFAVENLRRANSDLSTLNFDLRERIKEQNCLYDVIRLTADRDDPLEEVMAEVVPTLRGGWLYSDDLVVDIDIGGKRFVSEDHAPPVSSLSAPLTHHDAIIGMVTVGYRNAHPPKYRGPFLAEEVRLLESVAARLSGYVRRQRADEAQREGEERWREVFDATRQPLLLLENGRFFAANRASLDMLAMRSPSELVGRSPGEISPWLQPDGRRSDEKAMACIAEAFDQGFNSFEWEHVRADGEHFIAQVVLTRIVQHGKSVLLAVWNDISREKRAQAKLESAMAEANRFREALDHVSAHVYMKDREHRYIYANRPTLDLFGTTLDELIGSRDSRFLPPATAARVEQIDDKVLTGASTEEEVVVDDGAREKRILWEVKAPLYADAKRTHIVGLCGISSDITERKALEARLEQQARTDCLTGLPNRGHFFDVAERELARARRYKSVFSVAMIDIDHFKLVNDSHGHHAGDVVLKEFSDICRSLMRETDIIGRIGGEEFAILFPQTDAQQAFEAVERIRSACAAREMSIKGQRPFRISISAGVALYAGRDVDVDALLGRADMALYAAKVAGRNKTAVADPERA